MGDLFSALFAMFCAEMARSPTLPTDCIPVSAAERSLSQHLVLASVEGFLPAHEKICMRCLEVGKTCLTR